MCVRDGEQPAERSVRHPGGRDEGCVWRAVAGGDLGLNVHTSPKTEQNKKHLGLFRLFFFDCFNSAGDEMF